MLPSDKSCPRQAKPALSQHPSYPLTLCSIMLWFTAALTPTSHQHHDSRFPPHHLHLHPSSWLSKLAPILSFSSSFCSSFLFFITLFSFPLSVRHPPSNPRAFTLHFFLRFILQFCPSPFCLQVFITLPAYQSSRKSGKRHQALSPGSVTPVTGTNCPPVFAYTAAELRTCVGNLACLCERERLKTEIYKVQTEYKKQKQKMQTECCLCLPVRRIRAIRLNSAV